MVTTTWLAGDSRVAEKDAAAWQRRRSEAFTETVAALTGLFRDPDILSFDPKVY